MKLIEMRPGQIRAAAEANVPMVMASGVVEYHGPHLPVGVDYLIPATFLAEVERRAPDRCVLAPGLPFGTTGSWAGGAIDGEVDLPGDALFAYVKPILKAYLGMGFRRILICQHHQGLDGVEGLCLQRAAAELALEQGQEQGGGARWGRLPDDRVPKVFGNIKVVSPTSFATGEPLNIPWGHGSYGETEYIHAVLPHTVDMTELDRMTPLPRWLRDSHTSTGDEGKVWFERLVTSWVEALSQNGGGQ